MILIKKMIVITFLMLSMHNIVAMQTMVALGGLVAKNVLPHAPEAAWLAAKVAPQYMPTVLSAAPFVLNGPGVAMQAGCMVGSILLNYVAETTIYKTNKLLKRDNLNQAQHLATVNSCKKYLSLLTIALQLGLQISALCYQKRMASNTAMYALLYSCISVLPWGVKVYRAK